MQLFHCYTETETESVPSARDDWNPNDGPAFGRQSRIYMNM